MITADTITDEQIRKLRATVRRIDREFGRYDADARRDAREDARICDVALAVNNQLAMTPERHAARARCAEILNARAKESA